LVLLILFHCIFLFPCPVKSCGHDVMKPYIGTGDGGECEEEEEEDG
jgi:hypothetical protein